MLVAVLSIMVTVVSADQFQQNPVFPKPAQNYFPQKVQSSNFEQSNYQYQNEQPDLPHVSNQVQSQVFQPSLYQYPPQPSQNSEVQPPTKSNFPAMHQMMKSIHLMQNNPPLPHLKYDTNEMPTLSTGNEGLDKNYGDRAAQRDEFPFNIQIRYNGKFACSGTLVRSPITGKHIVVTATHCLVDKGTSKIQPIEPYELRAGILRVDEIGQSRRLKQVLVHPGFTICSKTSRPIFDDIGIIILDQEFEENQFVRPLEFPRIDGPTLFDYVDIQGWGKGREPGHMNTSSVLRVLKLKVWDNEDCDKVYFEESGEHIITEEHFCAGTKEGGKDACQGDSGSTVVATDKGKNYFSGIVSWGKGTFLTIC